MKRIWTEERDNLLRRHYPKRDLDWVARRIGVSKAALKCRARILGIRRKVHRREPWTDRQLAYLRKHYADRPRDVRARKGVVQVTATEVFPTTNLHGFTRIYSFLYTNYHELP